MEDALCAECELVSRPVAEALRHWLLGLDIRDILIPCADPDAGRPSCLPCTRSFLLSLPRVHPR